MPLVGEAIVAAYNGPGRKHHPIHVGEVYGWVHVASYTVCLLQLGEF